MLKRMLVIVLVALIVSACSTSRVATLDVSRSRFQDSRDSVNVEQVMVAVHDTIREITTITVDRNDVGDTIFRSVVTDRERIRNAADVRSKTVDVRVVRDTVYVEKRDSSYVKNTNGTNDTNSRASPFVSSLKWIFFIIVSLIVLIVVIKFLK